MTRTFAGFSRITWNPEVMGGKPCIRGMRVTVGMVLGNLGAGASIDELLAAYPYIEREDILESIRFGAWLLTAISASNLPREVRDRRDMGPEWIACLANGGYQAVHWSTVGQTDADEEIMQWARDNEHVVLTADLDFGTKIIRRSETRPSVVQLRTEDTLVRLVGRTVLAAIEAARSDLSAGALVTVEPERTRIRRLSPDSA